MACLATAGGLGALGAGVAAAAGSGVKHGSSTAVRAAAATRIRFKVTASIQGCAAERGAGWQVVGQLSA